MLGADEIGLHPQIFPNNGLVPHQQVLVTLQPWRGPPRPCAFQGPFVLRPLLVPEGSVNPKDPELQAHALAFYGAVLPWSNDMFDRVQETKDKIVLNTLAEEYRWSESAIVRALREHAS